MTTPHAPDPSRPDSGDLPPMPPPPGTGAVRTRLPPPPSAPMAPNQPRRPTLSDRLERLRRTPGPEAVPFTGAALAVCLAAGIGVDLAVGSPFASLGVALTLVVPALGILLLGRVRTWTSRGLVVSAALLGVSLTVSASPWLTVLNALCGWAVLLVGISVGRVNGGPHGFLAAVNRLGHLPRHIAATPSFVTRPLATRLSSASVGQVGQGLTGIAVGVPLGAFVFLLLADGDLLFGRVVSDALRIDPTGHLVALAGGAALMAVLIRAASTAPASPPASDPSGRIQPVQELGVLGCLAVVHAAFCTVQLFGMLGGADEILADAATTSAWAREGFFQLLWAVGITLAAMLGTDTLVTVRGRENRRWRLAVRTLLAATSLVLVAISVSRIAAYSSTFGLTMLRLYSATFAVFLGLVAVIHLVTSVGPPERRPWFGRMVVGAGIGLVVVLNLVNPEVLVVGYDLASPERFDSEYLARLSPDAIPVLVEAVEENEADPGRVADLRQRLCERELDSTSGVAWNRSRSNAQRALSSLDC